MSDKVLGWHWLPASTKVEVGQTLTTEGPLKYASPLALDALKYASGPVICRISSSGKVSAMADATKILHESACRDSEQDLLREREAGREPDPRSWTAIKVKRKWMKGEATDEELSIASDAAWAAWSTAWDAAWVASWAAAWPATWGFWGASWDAVRAAQNAKLEEMLNDLLKEGEGK